MNTKPSAALLIDADNLSPEGMERALADLQLHGLRVTVRRAYGSHETLAAIKDFLQAHSVRAVVNQGKGTTDAALIVDAMDLLHRDGLPAVVAIGSGDGDFTPLVVRLREAGKTLICLAQRRKAAEGLDRTYDEVIYVDAPVRASRAPAPVPAPTPAAPARTAARKATPPRQAASRQRAAPAPSEDPIISSLRQIPGFLDGDELEMNVVVSKLRDEKLMPKNTSAPTFFRKHALNVRLWPEKQPNKIRWLG